MSVRGVGGVGSPEVPHDPNSQKVTSLGHAWTWFKGKIGGLFERISNLVLEHFKSMNEQKESPQARIQTEARQPLPVIEQRFPSKPLHRIASPRTSAPLPPLSLAGGLQKLPYFRKDSASCTTPGNFYISSENPLILFMKNEKNDLDCYRIEEKEGALVFVEPDATKRDRLGDQKITPASAVQYLHAHARVTRASWVKEQLKLPKECEVSPTMDPLTFKLDYEQRGSFVTYHPEKGRWSVVGDDNLLNNNAAEFLIKRNLRIPREH